MRQGIVDLLIIYRHSFYYLIRMGILPFTTRLFALSPSNRPQITLLSDKHWRLEPPFSPQDARNTQDGGNFGNLLIKLH